MLLVVLSCCCIGYVADVGYSVAMVGVLRSDQLGREPHSAQHSEPHKPQLSRPLSRAGFPHTLEQLGLLGRAQRNVIGLQDGSFGLALS